LEAKVAKIDIYVIT